MRVYIYLTTPSTGRTHLAEFDAYHRDRTPRTGCGLPAANLTEGDETASGFLADCLTCLRTTGRVHARA